MSIKKDIYDKLFTELYKDKDFPNELLEKIKFIFESDEVTYQSLVKVFNEVHEK